MHGFRDTSAHPLGTPQASARDHDHAGVASAHVDTFARDNLPPREAWPDFLYDLPELRYPDRLNCSAELIDRHVREGRGERTCVIAPGETLAYADFAVRVNRIANVLVRDLGLVPGERVLLRGPNNPTMLASVFAVIKAGGIAIATMPLLRAKEIAYPLTKAQVRLALCDHRLAEEMEKARATSPTLERVVRWGEDAPGSLDALMAQPGYDTFAACDTSADDICLIAFTSGTTGEPKASMHMHRDMLATCDTYGRHVLRADPDDRFIGSPPLGFTFGLGGLGLFPLRIGAAIVLIEQATPPDLLAAIARFRASVVFTAPTAYRAMLPRLAEHDVSSLRICVSAGETLPKPTYEAWRAATGIRILDGIGATEMLHIFIGSPEGATTAGATGLPVPGYRARVVDEAGHEVPRGTIGRLAVRGPTGCRYLADARQSLYVQDGWNLTGDLYRQDEDGVFWYHARADDMIVSAGYNIAGPEVEAALLEHPAVAECAVVGMPDDARGQIVTAYVVLREAALPPGDDPEPLVKALQAHVKATIAPYKYPRRVAFVARLPKTRNGKIRRFALRAGSTEDESG